MNFKVSIEEAINKLSKEETNRFTTVMQHGSMSVEYYAPQKIDLQKPHKQDELYIIANGSGTFSRDNEKVNCETGDVLFVPAGMEHRFEHFTTDFDTWVIFYGPAGGEKD